MRDLQASHTAVSPTHEMVRVVHCHSVDRPASECKNLTVQVGEATVYLVTFRLEPQTRIAIKGRAVRHRLFVADCFKFRVKLSIKLCKSLLLQLFFTLTRGGLSVPQSGRLAVVAHHLLGIGKTDEAADQLKLVDPTGENGESAALLLSLIEKIQTEAEQDK